MTDKKKRERKNLILIIAATIILYGGFQAALYWLTLTATTNATTIKTIPIEQQLTNASNIINSMCPYMADAHTRLDETYLTANHLTFHFNYTLPAISICEFDKELFEAKMRPVVKNKIKTDISFKLFRDSEITMNFQYFDINGQFLHRIVMFSDEYLSESDEEVIKVIY